MAEVAAGVAEQVMVGVREAAQLAGVSTKQVRKWVREGAVRAEQVAGKFGPTWQIEAASIPLTRKPLEAGIPRIRQGLPLEGEGSGNGSARGEGGAVQALAAMLSDLQRRHEGAVARLGQLEGEREQRLALEERARSLIEKEAAARAETEAERRRVEELGAEVGELRRRLTWRTWATIILAAAVIGFAVAAAVAWAR